MKFMKLVSFIVSVSLIFGIVNIKAFQGDMGYEGGVSSGFALKSQLMKYKEVVIISGEPIELNGTVLLKKSIKIDNKTGDETITTNYKYSLNNDRYLANLVRDLTLITQRIKKDNGQIIEKTELSVKPTEVLKIGEKIFTLDNIEFTKSNIVDEKPAINYYTGTLWSRKTYKIRANNSPTSNGEVVYETTGTTYGYDQYWSSVETIILNSTVQTTEGEGNEVDAWGGSASIKMSNSSTKKINYAQNEIDTISFDGGYILEEYNKGITQYTTKMPEFDSEGVSTFKTIEKTGRLNIDTFPQKERLISRNLDYLKGHWSYSHVDRLYALEIFNDEVFNFNQYINRGEFTAAIEKAAKEVPKDPVYEKVKTDNTKESIKFSDMSKENKYYESVNRAYERGLVRGRGDNTFASGSYLTTADAITIMINSIGLDRIANWPGAVSLFEDNDEIPDYARNSVVAAQKIGLIIGDENGYLKPLSWLTKARAAAIINNYIDFMRSDIKDEYSEELINYN